MVPLLDVLVTLAPVVLAALAGVMIVRHGAPDPAAEPLRDWLAQALEPLADDDPRRILERAEATLAELDAYGRRSNA